MRFDHIQGKFEKGREKLLILLGLNMGIDVKYTGSTPQKKYQECQQASFTPNGKLKRLFVIHLTTELITVKFRK